MKKVNSLLLALLMVFSLAVPALAAPADAPTVITHSINGFNYYFPVGSTARTQIPSDLVDSSKLTTSSTSEELTCILPYNVYRSNASERKILISVSGKITGVESREVSLIGDNSFTGGNYELDLGTFDKPVKVVYTCKNGTTEEITTLTVTYVPSCELTYVPNGGTLRDDDGTFHTDPADPNNGIDKPKTVWIAYNANTPNRNITRTGYDFAGWYSDVDLETPFVFPYGRLTNHLTLYADWASKPIEWTALAVNDGTRTVVDASGDPVIAPENGGEYDVTVPLTPHHPNYSNQVKLRFGAKVTGVDQCDITVNDAAHNAGTGGWYALNASDKTDATPFAIKAVAPTNKEELSFVLNVYYVATVTLHTDDAAETVEVRYGQAMDKPADPVKEGYIFDNWYAEGSTVPFDFDTPIEANIDLYAKFDASTITVTLHADGAAETVEVLYGQTVDRPADPVKAGYIFDNWYAEGSTVPFDFDTPIEADIDLYAKFNAPTITINSTLVGGQEVYLGFGSVNLEVDATVDNSDFALTYQWYKWTGPDTAPEVVAGATNSTLSVPGDITELAAGNHFFYCVVSYPNATDKQTNIPYVAVKNPAITVALPTLGAGNELSVAADVTPSAARTSLQYQWYRVSDGSQIEIVGATSETLDVNTLDYTAGAYFFTCKVSIGAAEKFSPQYRFVLKDPVVTVSIAADKTDVPRGETATLTATASADNGGALTYQWYTYSSDGNHTLITGATSSTLVLSYEYYGNTTGARTVFCAASTDGLGGATVTKNSTALRIVIR